MSLSALKSLIPWIRPPVARDCRSGRFVAVIDCVLNQNVRDRGAASFPAMNFELLQLCHAQGIGVMQMPCPEVSALGLKRERPAGMTVRQALDTDAGRLCCANLAASVATQMQILVDEGFTLVAVLGGNPRSPGCAVHAVQGRLTDDSGLFMLALQAELSQRGIEVPFRGVRDTSSAMLADDLQWFRNLLRAT